MPDPAFNVATAEENALLIAEIDKKIEQVKAESTELMLRLNMTQGALFALKQVRAEAERARASAILQPGLVVPT